MEQKPKRAVAAAITAAVMSYIKTQEEALNVTAAAVVPKAAAITTGSLYAASGRQQMMEMRRLLSLRMARH
jgi:ribosomal protein L7/L12